MQAYRCPAGVLTIGYGHTGIEVSEGMEISEETATDLLQADLAVAEKAINAESLTLTQHQFDALVSFVFNVGVGAFKRSTLLKMIRVNPRADNVRFELTRWNKVKGVPLPGLVKRRGEEATLYFTPSK